ncbi:MAG: hypothetical protein ABIA63_07775 [bacterium]
MAKYNFKTNQDAGLDELVNIENQSSIIINRLGCELISYRVFNSQNSQIIPLMYRDGLARTPQSGWKNHATVLFPIVGGIKDNESIFKENTIIKSRGNHGFARHSVFNLSGANTEDDLAKISYKLLPNQEIKAEFPFKFELGMEFAVDTNFLEVTQTIKNTESEKVMPCSWGWHPGFKTPIIEKRGKKSDIQLLMNSGTYTWIKCNKESRLTGVQEKIYVDKSFPWTEKDLALTIMLHVEKPENRNVILFDPNAGINIRMDFPDYPYLGFWSDENGPFICIEPGQGLDDHEEKEPFEDKVGMVFLQPGETREYKVTVVPEFI